MMKLFLGLILGPLILAAPLGAADKVRLSISSVDVSFLTAGVGVKRGFFRDEGLDVELIRMNANISVTALSTGDVDYTMIFASVVRGAMRGTADESAGELHGQLDTHVDRPPGIQVDPRFERQDARREHLRVDLRRGGADDDEAWRRGPGARSEDHSAWAPSGPVSARCARVSSK